MRKNLIIWLTIACETAAPYAVGGTERPKALRPFTVADDIACAYFGSPYSGGIAPIVVSPDGKLVAVHAERGILAENRVQDEIRVYDMEALRRFANDIEHSGPAEPVWAISKNTNKEGPIISGVRWLPDSSRLAFLVKGEVGHRQLWLAEPRLKTTVALTPPDQSVTAFDVSDATHFIYTVSSPGPSADTMSAEKVSAFDATGMSLYSPLMGDAGYSEAWSDRSELWAVHGGTPFPLHDSVTGRPIVLFSIGLGSLSLAPDGNLAAIALPVPEVPKEWVTLYRPPPRKSNYPLTAGRQDLDVALGGSSYASVFAIVNLSSGLVSSLTDAPTAASTAWAVFGRIAWSEDSRALLLPGTFMSSQPNSAPCLAVARLPSRTVECVTPVVDQHQELINSAQFAPGRADRVIVDTIQPAGHSYPHVAKVFLQDAQGEWQLEGPRVGTAADRPSAEVTVRQSLNDPPVLIVTDHTSRKSRVVWDPNPQLSGVELGEATIYHWAESSGKQWTGGLYKPPDYVPGRRYPLVVQTHGFIEDQFLPSGHSPTAFAARALAAAGIVVLQVQDLANAYSGDPDEGPSHIRGYAAAIKQLAADGVIDPDRVGMIGFSRTCIYTMQALTVRKLNLRAASIVQGVNAGYLQYLINVDGAKGSYERDAESIIGAAPFGAGLQRWFEESPEFNLDKITTPLLVIPSRGLNTIFMWEPYAGLRMLRKPVDLLVLNTSEHMLTNPGARLASQGGTVDWFRFWLKDEEDPDPNKADQYARWHKLRELHDADLKASGEPKSEDGGPKTEAKQY